ncbi:hypothetical protein FB45DRAFT_904876 [Roridomyces roridus]|uniref:O-fucosyltransferase family protein n=1 Tax=Roridomyces roridus TaxID=1738132 RepID=A0AAD7C5D9_9AGAR|nr:hypothetical protein FB45DRAFT_904876 [Roridomyces roridus]
MVRILTLRDRRMLGGVLIFTSACLLITMLFSPNLNEPISFRGRRTGMTAVSEYGRLLRRNGTVHRRPMPSFRDNLWPDKKYITSWAAEGWANEQIGFANLIWIGKLTDRIVILDGLQPQNWRMKGGDTLWFGDFFDLDYLSGKLGVPILEWRDVKDPRAEYVDSVGCWSSWSLTNDQHRPRGDLKSLDAFSLDVGYTRFPGWARLRDSDVSSNIFKIAQIDTYDGYRDSTWNNVSFESTISKKWMLPDQHLFCIDYLFCSSILHDWDAYDSPHAPSWRQIGQHMRWRADKVKLAQSYLRKAFGLRSSQPIPEFIAMHVRRTDFAHWCDQGVPLLDCLPQPHAFSRRVDEIQAEIYERHGKNVTHVLMVSDDPDPVLEWAQKNGKDWRLVDHEVEKTSEVHGGWYPAGLDAIFLSMASGIVRTRTSTYSLVSAHRVETWNDGPQRQVAWGRKNADDH